MPAKETIQEFHKRHGQEDPMAGQFNVYRREAFACDATSLPPNRRDFYKISLITRGTGRLGYADKAIHIDRPSIAFLNPLIPYWWEPESDNQMGFFCLFTEDFVKPSLKNESLSQSALFRVGGHPVFFPETESMQLLSGVFGNMLREMQSDYVNKYELLRSYVQIIMHEAMKMQPPETFYQPADAPQRISNLFLELLERQFPIDSPRQVVRLKNANEFAAQLNIHTNHLNRSLKEATGKTTTEWVSGRITREARSLLQYSSWDIAEIGYSLGFEHASNFIIFFRKQTGETPRQYRKALVVD